MDKMGDFKIWTNMQTEEKRNRYTDFKRVIIFKFDLYI